MRISIILIATILLSFLNVAVARDLKVDGSSKETYERSVKSMVEGMSVEEREIFGRGLLNLILTRYPAAQGAKGLAKLQFMTAAVEAAHITLDGVTQDEIMAVGKSIALEQDAKSAVKSEKTDNLGADLACLQSKVILTNVEIKKEEFGRRIRLSVTNGLTWAISGIRVNYVSKSKGRSVPWDENDFSLSISGGIEPGETKNVATTATGIPNDAPDELQTSANILDVADADKRLLLKDVQVFGWSEEKSLLKCE